MARLILGADFNVHDRAAVSFSFMGAKFLKLPGHKKTRIAVAPGIKLKLTKNLLTKISALVQVNEAGLRAKVIPSLGIEYVFF